MASSRTRVSAVQGVDIRLEGHAPPSPEVSTTTRMQGSIVLLVRFTLTYRGPLPSSGDRAKKHAIRVDFHPQLQELWRVHPGLIPLQYLVNSTDANEDAGAQLTEV